MDKLTPWQPRALAVIPDDAREPGEIIKHARQLSKRDTTQIVHALDAGHFDIASNYVWSKTMVRLKSRLEVLGSDFVGEMLERPEIDESTSLVQNITDAEAIHLAVTLGMFSHTLGLRLQQNLELLVHLSSLEDDDEAVEHHDAIAILKNCIKTVLGHDNTEAAVEFAHFRHRLETEIISTGDKEITALNSSPYFFIRTAIRVLISLAKSKTGAPLETALENLNTVLPGVWARLIDADKWSLGQTYAELHAAGQKAATTGVRRALLKVEGFDFVPETLRSVTFVRAANTVFNAHNEWDNFHNETKPMRHLASLGTIIPMPAFSRVMTATLSVYLGNNYGHSWHAEGYAKSLLDKLTPDQWGYFLDQCLPADSFILEKLAVDKPSKRWVDLLRGIDIEFPSITNGLVSTLLEQSLNGRHTRVKSLAKTLYTKLYRIK